MANYPFATIDPNVGMVEVPDNRLARIDELIPAKKSFIRLLNSPILPELSKVLLKGKDWATSSWKIFGKWMRLFMLSVRLMMTTLPASPVKSIR